MAGICERGTVASSSTVVGLSLIHISGAACAQRDDVVVVAATERGKVLLCHVNGCFALPHHFQGQTAAGPVSYTHLCHLCRGLNVKEAPRALIADAAEYVPCEEEEVCCGFGGSYSVKFPEISAQLLEKKVTNMKATGADRLVVDCPGCVMQLRGGAEKQGLKIKVDHISELLADNLKK